VWGVPIRVEGPRGHLVLVTRWRRRKDGTTCTNYIFPHARVRIPVRKRAPINDGAQTKRAFSHPLAPPIRSARKVEHKMSWIKRTISLVDGAYMRIEPVGTLRVIGSITYQRDTTPIEYKIAATTYPNMNTNNISIQEYVVYHIKHISSPSNTKVQRQHIQIRIQKMYLYKNTSCTTTNILLTRQVVYRSVANRSIPETHAPRRVQIQTYHANLGNTPSEPAAKSMRAGGRAPCNCSIMLRLRIHENDQSAIQGTSHTRPSRSHTEAVP